MFDPRQPKRSNYLKRFREHIEALRKHLDEGDYVQAAEKVWGALSSFVNAYSYLEIKAMGEKKQTFAEFFQQLSIYNKDLRVILNSNFRNIDDFTTKAALFHVYFYGERELSLEEFIKPNLEKAYKLLKEVKDTLESLMGSRGNIPVIR